MMLAVATRGRQGERNGQFSCFAHPTAAAHSRRSARSRGRSVAMKTIILGLAVAGVMASATAGPEQIGTRLNCGQAAATPSPLVGEGWGGGSGGCAADEPHSTTPTPNPSPQGGGEEFAAPLQRNLAPMGSSERIDPRKA